VGVWRCVPTNAEPSDDASVNIVANPAVAHEYLVTWREREKEPEQYRAFGSSVHGQTFLNLAIAEPKLLGDGWAFARYSLLRPNVLYVELMGEEPFKAKESSTTVAAARTTLEQAILATPTAIKDFCVCVKRAE
jgi:hypothetical protein